MTALAKENQITSHSSTPRLEKRGTKINPKKKQPTRKTKKRRA
jgi:hypothetical protein